MIQPIGAFSPRADFAGHGVAFKETPQEKMIRQNKIFGAIGLSLVLGALTTASAGARTSWPFAFMLGAFVTLFSTSIIGPLFQHSKLIGKTSTHNFGALSKEGTGHVATKLKSAKRLALVG